jgi:hypothetical protein
MGEKIMIKDPKFIYEIQLDRLDTIKQFIDVLINKTQKDYEDYQLQTLTPQSPPPVKEYIKNNSDGIVMFGDKVLMKGKQYILKKSLPLIDLENQLFLNLYEKNIISDITKEEMEKEKKEERMKQKKTILFRRNRTVSCKRTVDPVQSGSPKINIVDTNPEDIIIKEASVKSENNKTGINLNPIPNIGSELFRIYEKQGIKIESKKPVELERETIKSKSENITIINKQAEEKKTKQKKHNKGRKRKTK